MQQLRDLNERVEVLDSGIKELESINKTLAKLLMRKEELTELIIAAFDHEKEGQQTYEHRLWRIEVKTPFVYSLNKRAYAEQEIDIPHEYNPVKSSLTYTVDKRKCEEAMLNAPAEIRDLLIEIIDKKPGKPSVSIKERI